MANGSLCQECRARDAQAKLSPEELRACLVGHQSLEGRLLFRAGGLKYTRRFPDATIQDVNLSDQEREERIAQLNIPTFGELKVISANLIDMDYIPGMTMRVRKYEPQPGDEVDKKWVDAQGRQKSIQIPHYAIADVQQYVKEFRIYIDENYVPWASRTGGPYAIIASLLSSRSTAPRHLDLFHRLLFFILAALQKTSTDYISGGDTLDTPVIDDEGHRLHGKRLTPRISGAQIDPATTLAILIPAQRELLASLETMLDSDEVVNWGPCFLSLAALGCMGAIMFADRRRHGQENSFEIPYSVPEFVVDASGILTLLIARFHRLETLVGRGEGLEAADPAIREYFWLLMAKDLTVGGDITKPEWWLEQLVADQTRWAPRPTPCM